MDSSQPEQRQRYVPGEVIISEVTKDDLQSIAEGYYASFPKSWFDKVEPKHLCEDDSLRVERFAVRMLPWLSEPHTRWTKATIHPSSPEYDPSVPKRVIGHAGWTLPGRTMSEILNFWRRDASNALGWREKMGWTKDYEDELWSGTDVEANDEAFVRFDRVRAEYLGGVGHWHHAPLWVHPDHQRRGVASLLLRDAIELADKDAPVPPMYLEAMRNARAIYEKFGFRGVEGEGANCAMIKNLPESVKTLGKKRSEEQGAE